MGYAAAVVAQFDFNPLTDVIDPASAFGVRLASFASIVPGRQFTIEFGDQNDQPAGRIQVIGEAFGGPQATLPLIVSALPNPLSGLDITIGDVSGIVTLSGRFSAAGVQLFPVAPLTQNGIPLVSVVNPSPGVFQLNTVGDLSAGSLQVTAEGLAIGDGSYASAFFSGPTQIVVETNTTDQVTGVNVPTDMGFNVTLSRFVSSGAPPAPAGASYRFTVIRFGTPVVTGS